MKFHAVSGKYYHMVTSNDTKKIWMAKNFSLEISGLIFGVPVVCHQRHSKLVKRIGKS